MRRSLVALAVPLILAVMPPGAWAVSGQRAHSASLYRIPTPPATPAAAAHMSASDVAGELSDLTPHALAAKGGIALGAAVSGPGALTVVVTAEIHGGAVVIGSGHRIATTVGAVSVKLTLTQAGKTALATYDGGRLRVTVSVIFRAQHTAKRTASARGTLK